jgi:hypothetical protein
VNLGFRSGLGFTLEFCDCWKKSHGEGTVASGERRREDGDSKWRIVWG